MGSSQKVGGRLALIQEFRGDLSSKRDEKNWGAVNPSGSEFLSRKIMRPTSDLSRIGRVIWNCFFEYVPTSVWNRVRVKDLSGNKDFYLLPMIGIQTSDNMNFSQGFLCIHCSLFTVLCFVMLEWFSWYPVISPFFCCWYPGHIPISVDPCLYHSIILT